MAVCANVSAAIAAHSATHLRSPRHARACSCRDEREHLVPHERQVFLPKHKRAVSPNVRADTAAHSFNPLQEGVKARPERSILFAKFLPSEVHRCFG